MPITAQDRIQNAALRLFAEKGSTQITLGVLIAGTVLSSIPASRSILYRA